MQALGTYTIVDLIDFSALARGQALPRPAWSPEQWADPGALVPNCPVQYQGLGWWPEFEARAILAAGERFAGPVWRDPDPSARHVVADVAARAMTAEELTARRQALRSEVNTERDARWVGTVPVDVRGDGSLIVPVDVRGEVDLRNIHSLTTTAQLLVSESPGETIPFRDGADTTHNLAPLEVITLGLTVQAYMSGVYARAWALKDTIKTASAATLDGFDVTAESHWVDAP